MDTNIIESPTTTDIKLITLGPKNSFSDQAAKLYEAYLLKRAMELAILITVQIVLCSSHSEVFNHKTTKGEQNIFIIPVANSTTGLVPPEATADFEASDYRVISGFEISINHYLLSKSTGTDLSDPANHHLITEIISHNAGAQQSMQFINKVDKVREKHAKNIGIEFVPVKVVSAQSTSAAAFEISKLDQDSTVVALGSKEAGVQNNLNISQEPVQDNPENATTFVTLENPENPLSKEVSELIAPKEQPNKFIIKLSIEDSLGSLSKLITKLSDLGVDLDYIMVSHENGQNQVSPYISGTIKQYNYEAVSQTIAEYNPKINIVYSKQQLGTNLKQKSDLVSFPDKFRPKPEIETKEMTATLTLDLENKPGALKLFLDKCKKLEINLTGLVVFAKPNSTFANLKATWEKNSDQDYQLLERAFYSDVDINSLPGDYITKIKYQDYETIDGKIYCNSKSDGHKIEFAEK